jgi:hypothetical protein
MREVGKSGREMKGKKGNRREKKGIEGNIRK